MGADARKDRVQDARYRLERLCARTRGKNVGKMRATDSSGYARRRAERPRARCALPSFSSAARNRRQRPPHGRFVSSCQFSVSVLFIPDPHSNQISSASCKVRQLLPFPGPGNFGIPVPWPDICFRPAYGRAAVRSFPASRRRRRSFAAR